MELVKLTETIVKELVKDSDSITVKEFPSENEGEITIQVMVPEDEMGRVIGKQGKMLKEIGCYRGKRHIKRLPVRGQRTNRNAITARGGKRQVVANKKK